MWTERARIIKKFNEAISYIEKQDYFHDYRLGNLEIQNSSVIIMIEEDTREKHNDNAHIWEFRFENISNLNFTLDCIMDSYISEVLIENNEVRFGLTNGCISFYTEKISLGIPQIESV